VKLTRPRITSSKAIRVFLCLTVVDVDARPRASLQLLASLGGGELSDGFRINFRRLRFFCDLFITSLVAIINAHRSLVK